MARVEVLSEVAGIVRCLEVEVGAQVEQGTTIIILESMKMEIPVEAPLAGRIVEFRVAVENPVEEDQILAVIEHD